jgi:hypothetical protein
MEFISEFGFDVKKGKSHEFQEWLRENEKTLAQEAPEGWEYIGTYAAVISTEKFAGDFRQLWRHHSYGAQDTIAAAMLSGSTFAKLVDEMTERFTDQERGARESQTIMKSVIDVSFFGEERSQD